MAISSVSLGSSAEQHPAGGAVPEDFQTVVAHYKSEFGAFSLNEALKAKRTDVAMELLTTATKVQKIAMLRIDPILTRSENVTPIHFAIKLNNRPLIELMLRDLTDEERVRLLDLSYTQDKNKFFAIRLWSGTRGVLREEEKTGVVYNTDSHPLNLAIYYQTDLLETLINAYPADLIADKIFSHPIFLHTAVRNNDYRHVKLLLSKISPERESEYIMYSFGKKTLLFYANSVEIVKALLDPLTVEQRIRYIKQPYNENYTYTVRRGPNSTEDSETGVRTYYSYKYNENEKVRNAILLYLPPDERPGSCVIL
ncbi:MAG: hypothetical protein K1060chlam5_01270 [Candidatus Anoxychlamydiales bacterium]|nr:hypothetical protein [Candidatus Anoxychlamydiales bacterium]